MCVCDSTAAMSCVLLELTVVYARAMNVPIRIVKCLHHPNDAFFVVLNLQKKENDRRDGGT